MSSWYNGEWFFGRRTTAHEMRRRVHPTGFWHTIATHGHHIVGMVSYPLVLFVLTSARTRERRDVIPEATQLNNRRRDEVVWLAGWLVLSRSRADGCPKVVLESPSECWCLLRMKLHIVRPTRNDISFLLFGLIPQQLLIFSPPAAIRGYLRQVRWDASEVSYNRVIIRFFV